MLFMAHHADDQAETLLLRLFRGAGIRGAAAIPVQRPLGSAMIERPFLTVTRAEIASVADQEGIEYIEDPSNRDQRLDRNFIRATVLPTIQQHWPQVNTSLNRFVSHAVEANELLDSVASEDLELLVHHEVDERWLLDGRPALAIAELLKLSLSRRKNVLRYWLSMFTSTLPSDLSMSELDRRLHQ